MNKNILITCALPSELSVIKKEVKSLDMKGVSIKFLLTGVGNYNVIYTLKDYIDKNARPDFLINIWVCWVKENQYLSDNFLQVSRIKIDSNQKEFLPPVYIKTAQLISILSSEKIITSPLDLWVENYVDMESFWIDFICQKEKIPALILKKTFDIVWKESKNVNIVELQSSLKRYDYKLVLDQVREYLVKNIPQEENLLKYKQHFWFTFSEFEQFKKQRNKFIAFEYNFEDFFEENKDLAKKEFLEKLKNTD